MCTISLKSRDCDVRWPPCYYSHSLDPIEAVRPWSTLFASVLELVDYVSKQTTSVDVIFSDSLLVGDDGCQFVSGFDWV